MSLKENDIFADQLIERRAVWAEGYGKKESDIQTDVDGDFIVVEGSDSGHPSDEGYDGGKDKKIYLPEILEKHYFGI